MAKDNLTAQSIPHLEPGEYYDSNRKGRGLILRVLKSGTRRFEYRYRFAGKNKRYHIGQFPDVSLSDARNKHLTRLKLQVNSGIDPQAELEKTKKQEEERQLQAASEKTFQQLVDEYKGAEFHLLRQATRDEYIRIIKKELLPAFRNKPVKEITTKQILSLLDKKAYVDGSPTMANRIRSRLHTIFEHGVGRCITENPVSEISRYKGENESERYYNDYEIRKLWQHFENIPEPVQSYLKIITLTGQRRTETQFMQWDHIQHMDDKDFKGWVWVIPSELSKSGRTHEVPLSAMALDIIRSLPRIDENPFVFTSFHSNGKPIARRTITRTVKDIQDVSKVSDFRLHHMRRTVSTYMAKMGIPQEVNSKILNHKSGGGGALTKIYNRHDYRPERQKALRQWELRLQKILTGEKANINKIG